MNQFPLSEWLSDHVGPGRRYSSARELSIAAGLGHAIVTNIRQSGRGDPLSLIALADCIGTPRTEVFIKAGWLRPEDVVPDLTSEEASVITGLRSLPAAQKRVILSMLSELTSPSSQSGELKIEVEEKTPHPSGK